MIGVTVQPYPTRRILGYGLSYEIVAKIYQG